MADEKSYTRYQKNVIRRYYENREAASATRLGEIVTELYLATSEKKIARLWEQAETNLRAAGANDVWLDKTVKDRNIEQLAELVREIF